MKISGAKTVLRRRKFFNSCPTQALCLMLVSGIVIAHFHVVTLPPSYWLLIMLAASAFAILVKNELHKSLLILAAFLLAGALLTSLQEEQNRQPAATRSYSHLSALDRTRLKALSLRSELTERIGSQHLASQQQAIITAMTLGEKGSLSKDTRQTFKASGASHILAISGLHIGIIFQLFILLAGGRKRWRLIAVPISVTAIWAYVFLIALPASAVRAASMISIYCFALLTRRNSTAVSNLTLAAIVMLIIQPLHLFDISFQLSFAAVLSILLLYKPIYSLLPASVTRRKPLGWAWAMVAVSVAAQVGTTPLVCYYFGNIACYSVLSSFVAIPAATVIIYVSLSLLLSFFLLPGFSLLQGGLVYLLSLTTSATQHALQLIVMLPGACIEGIKISILQLGLIYIAIIAGCLLIQKLHRCLLHRIHLPSDSHRDYSQQEYQTSPSD